MENNKLVDTLNLLIEIHNDRIEGYQTASAETEDIRLKQFFSSLGETSIRCKNELSTEVRIAGGIPAEGTQTTGKIYRIWMDLKAMVTGKDTKAILNSCLFGEEAAEAVYNNALNLRQELPENISILLEKQYELLKIDYNRVKVMRNSTQ